MMQNRDLLWVNGPNRQFEKAAEAVMAPNKFGNTQKPYEVFYLMEPDSVPWKRHWLTSLLAEMASRRPFAVLGSKYQGYKWHDFEEELPLPLLHHLNGKVLFVHLR